MPLLTVEPHGSVELPYNAWLRDLERGRTYGLVFGCRLGICGVCVVEISSGQDALGRPTEREERTLAKLNYPIGPFRLACQCQIKGDVQLHSVNAKGNNREHNI